MTVWYFQPKNTPQKICHIWKFIVEIESNSPQLQNIWALMDDRPGRSHTTGQRGESQTGRGQTRWSTSWEQRLYPPQLWQMKEKYKGNQWWAVKAAHQLWSLALSRFHQHYYAVRCERAILAMEPHDFMFIIGSECKCMRDITVIIAFLSISMPQVISNIGKQKLWWFKWGRLVQVNCS